jgi:hypothetical protein
MLDFDLTKRSYLMSDDVREVSASPIALPPHSGSNGFVSQSRETPDVFSFDARRFVFAKLNIPSTTVSCHGAYSLWVKRGAESRERRAGSGELRAGSEERGAEG